jgi:small nuclear ribonucleoprotein (snRNP)-like protein
MTSQIDLSKYVGKKVRVTFTDGRKDEYIIVETCIKEFPFKIGMGYYTNLGHSRYGINNIEEIMEPEKIDLSKYVGKKVRVTLRNNETYEGKIIPNEGDNFHFPYRFQPDENVYFRGYTVTGCQSTINCERFDIMKIEEINEIQELENKVKELQAQIDRLQKKEVPKIKCIEVTRTIVYDPETYLDHCYDKNITPSQSGFLKYTEGCFDEDFGFYDGVKEEIKELEVWNED